MRLAPLNHELDVGNHTTTHVENLTSHSVGSGGSDMEPPPIVLAASPCNLLRNGLIEEEHSSYLDLAKLLGHRLSSWHGSRETELETIQLLLIIAALHFQFELPSGERGKRSEAT